MKRILFTILIIISLTGDSYSQRIPFAFWNRLDPDTLELDAPTLIAPADDTTGVDQSPLLDWDGVIYATNYIVQLDNDTNFSPISWTDTTVNSKATVELGLVQGTTWYWRVLAFNLFDTSEWSVTYSFTVTTGPALTTPVLVLPRDDTTNVIQYPVLDWDTVINVRHYVVQLSDTISFTDIYWSDSLTQSTSTVDSALDYASTWYWRVIAYNDFDTSDWSAIYTFTIQDPTIAAPTLLTPANGATGQSQSPTLVWSATDEADFYNVQLTQWSDFSSVLWNQNTFDTSRLVDMTLLEGTKWYWRARAINATDTSNWSSTFAFIVTEGAATARTYYVDSTDGKDEYNGRSTTTPWQTLTKVNTQSFIAGDTLLFKGGKTYAGKLYAQLTHNDTVNKFTVSSYGTGRATIYLGATDTNGISVRFTQHVNVDINNINVTGRYDPDLETGGANVQRGIYVWSNVLISPLSSNYRSFINIKNCTVRNVKDGGIVVTSFDYGKTFVSTIDSNVVYDVGRSGIAMNYNWHSSSNIKNNIIHDVYGHSADGWNSGINLSMNKGVNVFRNLIYNIGANSIVSGIGINTSGKSYHIHHNEIYQIWSNTGSDGEAIDFENGTDSSIAEHNYLHDSPGMGILVSGNTSAASVNNNYLSYITERGSMDSGNADYNVIRYNLIKNIGSKNGHMGIKLASGDQTPSPAGRNNQIYNNTIISTHSSNSWGLDITGSQDSTKVFNNIIAGDYTLFMLIDSVQSKTNSTINNNVFWSRTRSMGSFAFLVQKPATFSTFNTFVTNTGFEATKYAYNPLLYTTPYTTIGDTLNDPYDIESISKYIPVDGSLMINNGAALSRYTLSTPTTDIRGVSVNYASAYDIGAYEDTTSSPYSYTAESKRWFGRMDTLQTAAQMKLKDSLIAFLKADTLYTKMDLLYIFANLDTGSAKLNVLKDTFNITTVGSPAFTTNYGYTGNGSSSYLNTEWTPSTSAVNYKLDSANASIYCLSNVSEDKSVLGTGNAGINFIRIDPRTSANVIDARLNENGATTTANTNSIGLFSVTRTAANAIQVYKNDTALKTTTNASSSLSSAPLFILARNGNGTAADFTTRQVSIVAIGDKLNEYSHYRLTDNLNFYLNRLGTTSVVPLKPRLISPANGDTGVSLTATLSWKDLNNKSTYHVQVSYLSDFSALVGEMTNVTTNSYEVGGANPGVSGSVTLLNNQTHYWRVRAINSAGNGNWSNTNSFVTPSTYDPASIALFARFPNGVGSIARKDLIDSLIKTLKSDTIWSKLDLLYMFAAEDTGQAKVNWINSSYTVSLQGSTKPTFTAEQGFTGNGSTAYLNTAWTPSTSAVNFLLDSSSVFTYIRNSVTEDKSVLGTGNAGVNFIRLNPNNTSNQIDARINENGASTVTVYNPKGLYSIIRSSASSVKVYKNDSLKVTTANASSGRSSVPMFLLAHNGNGSAALFSTRQLALFMAGGKFSDYTQTIIHRRIEWYLNRIGAYVLVPSQVWLTSPANTATGVSISTDFDWENVGANYYQIEIDDDIAFGSPYYSANTAGSEEINDNIGEFTSNTTYYWRVRGVNTIGTGAWSSTYSFTTAP